ncbi:MAG: hypothetical protein H7A21_14220 [Spirochaetales bacterium]|nr:hypothetical protein [Leptospiraceae bacterium]MCP5482587.1 hypothetical protein [Spirochaetales bacterium]MCP5485176.1 hypothetical protein [Spirochaetales bacterium]
MQHTIQSIITVFRPAGLRCLAACLCLCSLAFCASRPVLSNDPGAQQRAEELKERMLARMNFEAWQKTAAIEFRFQGAGADRRYLWDRNRRLVQVQWEDDGQFDVRYRLEDLAGEVRRNGQLVSDSEERAARIDEANAYFVNDAFWLSPLLHVASPGAQISAPSDHELALHFSSGGVTPGDTYLFEADASGELIAMRMWVSVIPFPGYRATFEEYQTTETGVRFARVRDSALFSIETPVLASYATYPEAGPNIFESILP